MSSGAVFIAVFVLVAVSGGLAGWTWLDWRERHRESERVEMERWAEPYRFGRQHGFHKSDELTERPLLPEDYKQWQSKK